MVAGCGGAMEQEVEVEEEEKKNRKRGKSKSVETNPQFMNHGGTLVVPLTDHISTTKRRGQYTHDHKRAQAPTIVDSNLDLHHSSALFYISHYGQTISPAAA